MQVTMIHYSAIILTTLLLPQAGLAGGSLGKALGGAVGSSTDDLGQALGKALDNTNVGRSIDNALPPGAGNVGRSGTAANPTAAPNFNPPSGPNFSAPNPKSIYGPGPVPQNVPGANTARNVPAQGQARPGYESAAGAIDGPVYDRVPELPSSPNYANRGLPTDGYDRMPEAPNRVQRIPSDPNLALQLPTPPTGTVRVANRQLARNASDTVIEPVAAADAAASPGFLKRNKKLIGGAVGGLALGGLGAGGYAIGADVAEGQAGGESKVTDAYNDTVEWGGGAVETVESWF